MVVLVRVRFGDEHACAGSACRDEPISATVADPVSGAGIVGEFENLNGRIAGDIENHDPRSVFATPPAFFVFSRSSLRVHDRPPTPHPQPNSDPVVCNVAKDVPVLRISFPAVLCVHIHNSSQSARI